MDSISEILNFPFQPIIFMINITQFEYIRNVYKELEIKNPLQTLLDVIIYTWYITFTIFQSKKR